MALLARGDKNLCRRFASDWMAEVPTHAATI